MGVTGVAVIDGTDAVILAGGDPGSAAASLGVVGSLFQEVLRQLSTVARAERRNHQLDLGIAWTAHEVRAPILAVKAALDHLSTANGSMAGGELLSRSGQELGYLAGLVDALLRWATGTGPLRRRPIDLVKVVRQAVESCRLECGDGRLKLDASMSLLIRADPMELRTAIANVLRNALAYAPKDTDVSVEVSLSDGLATVSVRDQGPGIPVEERDAIFDPFTRGRSGSSHRDGHGLGLFIARRVVEAHGGSIWAESSPGEGTTFRLQLPNGGNGAGPRNNRVTNRLPTDGGETRARSHR
jgi:signal transduction histidine kinase